MPTRTLPSRGVKPAPGLFLRRFLRNGKRVASVAPSSRSLARAICRAVDPRRPQTILELGAGTGAVTTIACQLMHPESRLIAVEVDPAFVRILRQRCPKAEVISADVRDLDRTLAELGIDRVDVVLNGLPTPSLPREVNQAVFHCLARVAPDAHLGQLTVMPWVYQGMYRRLFHEVRFELVVANIPPGGVYHCRGLRSDYVEFLPGKK